MESWKPTILGTGSTRKYVQFMLYFATYATYCPYWYSYDNREPPRLSRAISTLAEDLVPMHYSIIRETRQTERRVRELLGQIKGPAEITSRYKTVPKQRSMEGAQDLSTSQTSNEKGRRMWPYFWPIDMP